MPVIIALKFELENCIGIYCDLITDKLMKINGLCLVRKMCFDFLIL